MVVEDDPVQIRILVSKLNAQGYDVVVARDAVQGVPLARTERPSILLLDIGLPGGDGYLVLKRLQALLPLAGLPVIAMSGRSAATDRNRMLEAGASDYFEKPLDYPLLLARVAEILGDAPSTSAAATETSPSGI
jgi:DNA-binding response OmpR family regulator